MTSEIRAPPRTPSVRSSKTEDDDTESTLADLRALEKVQTSLFPVGLGPYLTYNRVPWALEIRKEVSWPWDFIQAIY